MPKGKPLSAAHKAAISAGLKRYWAGKRSGSGGSSGGSGRSKSAKKAAAPKRVITVLETGKPISMEEAAVRMFGSAGAAKKLAALKKRKGSIK